MLYKKIIIAIDSSKHSKEALNKGVALAKQLGAALALVTVVNPEVIIGSAEAGLITQDLWDLQVQDAKDVLKKCMDAFPEVKFSLFMPQGKPQEEVVSTAKLWGADLIVTGTHGRSGFSHFLLGSVAESILKQSDIPVMMVRV